MKLPGLAWLEFGLDEVTGGTRVRQRALYHPRGLLGHAYWWSVAPFHAAVFPPMAAGLAREAERLAAQAVAAPAHPLAGAATG
jgi:hypothetical protein